MRRRFAILAIVAAATLPAALVVQVARAQQPATQPPAAPSTPPAQQPTPPAKPAPQSPATPTEPAQTGSAATAKSPGLGFAATAGMIFSPIKPGQEAAFEEVLGKVQEALAKSTDPVRKQQAASWKVYKATEPFQNTTLYISVMDPAVKGADYNVFPILQDAYGDVAAREIFEKFRAAYAGGQNVTNVTPVFVMSTGKVAPPAQ